MTDPISVKPIYPHLHELEGEVCGPVDEKEGYCKVCGMYLSATNMPELTDDDIPF